jgi:uncharacterized protein YjaG (DUF416 family)
MDDRLEDSAGYSQLLGAFIQTWSAEQRIAFAAALAERWSLVYESASRAQPWGKPAEFCQAVAVLWQRLEANAAPPADFQPGCRTLLGSTPAKSAPLAHAACTILCRAAECCVNPASQEAVRQAALTAYEATVEVIPGYPIDRQANKAVWRQPAVQAEIGRQFALIQQIGTMPVPYPGAVEALKRQSRSEQLTPAHFMQAMSLCSPAQMPAVAQSVTKALGTDRSAQSLPDAMRELLAAPPSNDWKAAFQDLAGLARSSGPLLQPLADMISNVASSLERNISARTAVDQAMRDAEQKHRELLSRAMSSWEPDRVVMFVAVLAEQWLPVYESFSAAEKWGSPETLRRAVDAAWDHLLGRPLAGVDQARYRSQVADVTPTMEEFDALPPATASAEIVEHLLECCGTTPNVESGVAAAISACEMLALNNEDDDEQAGGWLHVEVQKEIARQTKLLESVGSIAHLDHRSIDSLRRTRGVRE